MFLTPRVDCSSSGGTVSLGWCLQRSAVLGRCRQWLKPSRHCSRSVEDNNNKNLKIMQAHLPIKHRGMEFWVETTHRLWVYTREKDKVSPGKVVFDGRWRCSQRQWGKREGGLLYSYVLCNKGSMAILFKGFHMHKGVSPFLSMCSSFLGVINWDHRLISKTQVIDRNASGHAQFALESFILR